MFLVKQLIDRHAILLFIKKKVNLLINDLNLLIYFFIVKN